MRDGPVPLRKADVHPQLRPRTRARRGVHRRASLILLFAKKSTPKALDVVGMALALCVAAYTGVMLGNAEQELQAFLAKSDIPVASTLLGLSAVPTSSPQYVGMLGMHGNYGPPVSTPSFLQKTCTSSMAGAPVPSAKYQQLVSTMSTPATMAASIEARP